MRITCNRYRFGRVLMENLVKTVFLGLDAAGKTTILNILSQRYSFISNIAPTKSIERHKTEIGIFGFSILNWDVPGQQKYREELTFNDARTLQDANVLIFVIDVQDIDRTPIAIDYYQRVINKITEQGHERPYIAILMHKMDPDIQANAEILKNAKRIQEQISKLSTGFNVDYFLTSMFVQPTIFIAFSGTVRKSLSRKKQTALKEVLHYFSDELILNAIILLDQNNFIVNHFEQTPADFNILQDFVYTLNSAYKNAKTHGFASGELKLSLENITFVFLPLLLNTTEIIVAASSHDSEVSFTPQKEKLTSALKKAID